MIDPLEFEWYHEGAKEVRFAASFTDWQQVPAEWSEPRKRWIVKVNVPKGKHQFKWIIDGEWVVDPDQPQSGGDFNNNVLYFF